MIVAGLLAAACTPGSTATAAPTRTSSSNAPATSAAPSEARGRPSLPSQTDTAWGRIWDSLPPSFPMPLGSQPATDTGEVSSGQLLVPSTREAVVDFYRDAFRDAQFTVGTDGPLEDGSVIVTASNGSQCRIQVSVRAAGTQSMVTVLYGAGCPFA
jgi:hypothetical protein